MKQTTILVAFTFLVPASFAGTVADELATLEASFGCPSEISFDYIFDGGSVEVDIRNNKGECYRLYFDDADVTYQFDEDSPHPTLEQFERETLKDRRKIVYLRSCDPESKLLGIGFKSEDEERLKKLISNWSRCSPKHMVELSSLSDWFEGERVRPIENK